MKEPTNRSHPISCDKQYTNQSERGSWESTVPSASRIDKIIGLLCRIWSLLQGSFAKETYNLIDPRAQSHLSQTSRANPVKWHSIPTTKTPRKHLSFAGCRGIGLEAYVWCKNRSLFRVSPDHLEASKGGGGVE